MPSPPEPPVLAIVGATATGKSALGMALAEQLEGEIINADALQLYRGLDIGTAKPTAAERQRVPHHLIDVVDLILPDAKGQVRTHYTLIDFYGHCADESADEGADEAPRDALGRPEPRPGDDADAAVWAPVTELDAYGLWAETRRIITQSRVLKSSAAKSG